MNKVCALSLAIGLILTPVLVRAGEQQAAAPAVANEAAQPVEVGNKICPVSHEEVGKNGMQPYKVTYKGKVYNLCCGMCEKDFNKDPEKYSKIMDEEAVGQATVK